MTKLAGVPASPGIIIGKAFIHAGNDLGEIKLHSITKGNIESELERLNDAFETTAKELKAIHERALGEMGKEQADIFAAHIMILEDPDFRDLVTDRIKKSLENAEWAVWDVSQNLIQTMMAASDPLFRERAADIADVYKRVLGHLLGSKIMSLAELEEDIVLAAWDLLPSEILTMNKKHVKGIVMDQGGNTSHTAILARAFNIPAVLGLGRAMHEIRNGDVLAVDGSKGEVIVNPEKKELEKFKKTQTGYQKKEHELSKLRNLPAETRDGFRVILKANIEMPEEAETALHYGAEGIGLYRSEFLFLGSAETCDEEYQVNAYSHVLKAISSGPVTIRTMDIGGDKVLPEFEAAAGKNPLLGWRAIRFSLAQPELFKTQLRAILRASVSGKARIMFPLISGMEELEKALAILEEAKTECRKKGQAFDEGIETGIMIEVPAAAVTADILAEKTGFFSIGTNDLVQYTLAVDRENEQVNYLAQPCHPAIVRFIKMTIDAARKKGIKTAMCGEMAGDPLFTALLLGLGLDEFSMTASSIPQIKKIIRELNMDECRALAAEVLQGVSATENKLLLESRIKPRKK